MQHKTMVTKARLYPTTDFIGKVGPLVIEYSKEPIRLLKPEKEVSIYLQYTKNPFTINKMGGVSGSTYDGQSVEILVNTSPKTWKQRLKAAVAHEINHATRVQKVGQSYKLVDSIASEGLAQCFEEEIANRTPDWAKAVSETKARNVWKSIKPRLQRTDQYWKVFHGQGNEYKRWSGYTLSYLIISQRIDELNLPWKDLVGLSSRKLVGKGLD